MFDVMEEQKIHDEAQTAESAEIAYSTLYNSPKAKAVML
jgi:hypothetical protein